jgi:hypothetical protein
MQDKTLEQMITEYEAQMPPEILNLIKSFDWKKEVRTIVNQNQLMIDIGADLEQAVNLMLLGALSVTDLYEQLTNAHELPDDKAKKIIGEVESQIFNPLHQKLIALDKKEEPKGPSMGLTPSRDDILAEIEKEPVLVTKPEKTSFSAAMSASVSTPATPANDIGINKPFSLSTDKAVEVQAPSIGSGEVVTGVQQDPVATGLQKPTVTAAPTKSYVADPYREPIE